MSFLEWSKGVATAQSVEGLIEELFEVEGGCVETAERHDGS
jgi:hypothetical protein